MKFVAEILIGTGVAGATWRETAGLSWTQRRL